MTSPLPETSSRLIKTGGLLTLVALVALGLVLRSPLTAVAPIVADLKQGLGADAVLIGLLTSIPVLCFGLLTPLASAIIGRVGIEVAIMMTLGGAITGLVLRSAGGVTPAVAGTVVIGLALTIGNIVSLMVIARDFARRMRFVTGLYTSALNVGTMLTSALTAPAAHWLGWRLALAGTVALAIPAAMLWGLVVIVRRRRRPSVNSRTGEQAAATTRPAAWRRPLAWLLVAAFACHLCVYYSLTAWLPAFLADTDGMDATTAGIVASIFQILALLGSFGAPALARYVPLSRQMIIVGLCWVTTPLGFLALPGIWPVWSILGGIASGGGFTVIFTLIMANARDLDENRAMSALVQGVGYTVSASGPMMVGSLHQATGNWTGGFAALSVIALVMTLAGLGVVRITRGRPAGGR